MSVNIQMVYNGELQTACVHTPSGSELFTDAPQDNGGKGSAFSPTDLVATALGSCILTTMALVAERNGIDLKGSTLSITKEMHTTAPRRIAKLTILLELKTQEPLRDEAKAKLTRAAHQCPVKLSLHPDVQVDMDIQF